MWCKVACMSDRDDFGELIGSARSVIKTSSFYFNGRIRYGTKGEKLEERLLCMDAIKVYICSIKMPVKVESQFNILSIKLIERVSDSHILIETDEKSPHSLYGLHDKSLEPFLIVLIRNLHAVFPYRLQAIVEIRPENEYDRLVRLSNESFQDNNIMSSETRPCGGFSLRYECACDFWQVPCNRLVQNLIDTVFAHRVSREFTFREFEFLTQKDWLPIISALRHNEWFTKLTIENVKLTTENIDELCNVLRLCKALQHVRLINCGLRHDFCTRFAHSLSVCHLEHLDLSSNTLEDKGLLALNNAIQQRKLPLISLNLQSCGLTQKSLQIFNTTLMNNTSLVPHLQMVNLAGNRLKEENCLSVLFNQPENNLEELHLTDLEFSLETLFNSLSLLPCKIRRLFISSIKASISPSTSGGVKSFFTKTDSIEVLQLSNANLSMDFLKELCDGLHSNIHLNDFDLRLPGNALESFVHEHAARLATIPCLTSLDLTGCDLDNEIPNLLAELKKNRKLKSLHFGRNFNNIKNKNMQKTINAMKDLLLESNLESFSIADSKLKENTAELLLTLLQNVSLKTLDIRGNLMGDTGARVLTNIVQTNRHLQTIYIDRNLLLLNHLEDLINALEDNTTIQYFPVPITDIILMKITEKDRMEKVQNLISRLDTICTRNQQYSTSVVPDDCLILSTAANLTREMNLSWEHQQQLIGHQASLDYIFSCSNRLVNNVVPATNHDEVNSLLSRTSRISKLSSQLYSAYMEEEEMLNEQWNLLCSTFQEKLREKNERLSRKFYQLFKEQTTINCDDKFQEQLRNYFSQSNENIDRLLTKEFPIRLNNQTRQCYINVATCLQKRAYDVTNDIAADLHKQMESTMLHTSNPQPASMMLDGSPSTLDRQGSRYSNGTNRQMKKSDSNECLTDPSPKAARSITRLTQELESRVLAANSKSNVIPSSPKPSVNLARQSQLINQTEIESNPISSDTIYSNVSVALRAKKKDLSIDDEADLIEHDLLDLVEQEQQKDEQKTIPPALPAKIRAPTSDSTGLDFHIEPTTKLKHPGKDRPRRANVRRPKKRFSDRSHRDSSSEGGLLTDENDETTPDDTPIHDPPNAESSSLTVTKFLKSALKTPKSGSDESSSSSTPKTPIRSAVVLPGNNSSITLINSMSKSMSIINQDSTPQNTSEFSSESLATKNSMSTSLYNPSQESATDPNESLGTSVPQVLMRVGKIPMGTRVLPILETHGDVPPVKLRHFQSEKKSPSSTDQLNAFDSLTTSTSIDLPSKMHHDDNNEQYKRLSVKERARMLTTTLPTLNPNEKKSSTPATGL